jgi:hypothetical protein
VGAPSFPAFGKGGANQSQPVVAFAVALAFLSVIPEGNLLFHPANQTAVGVKQP